MMLRRSSIFFVLALLVVLAISAFTPVEAIPHRRVNRLQAQQHTQQPVPTPAASLIQQSESVDSAASAASSVDAGAEIVQSLKQLLEQKKATGEAARAKLEAAAAHTLAVEAALAEKQQQLQKHNAMLARLEQCLASGPESDRYALLEKQTQAEQQSLLEAQSKVAAKDRSLQEAKEEIEQQREALHEQSQEIADKEVQLKKQQAHIAEQQSLLEQQARQVTEQEAQLHQTVAQQVEAGVQAKLAALKAEMEAASEEKLAAVRAAMADQAKTLLHEQQTVLLQQKASHIARIHEMHDLTAASSESPYAAQADEALAAESEQAEPALIETGAEPVVASAPAVAAPAAAAAVSANSTLSRWAQKLALHCASYDNCGTCSADGRCGWCSAGGAAGKCLALDVNANLRQGVSGDGLTSGQCMSDNWQTSVSARLTLLTLNVFASERANSTRRFAAIVQLIKKSGADVIALQEVEKWFIHALQAHSWVKNNYHFSEYGPGQAPGGLYILSRYPIASLSYYESIQPGQVEVNARARVLVAKLGVKQQALYVAATALDYRSSENRLASLEYIFRVLKPYRHVFLLGDFNFDDGSKLEAGAVPPSYLDLWPTLVQDRPGFTWDPRANWFAAASDPRSRASRIDRVYLRSNQWMPRSIHLVGCSVSDPLCGAKNLDIKKGVTVVDANKLNPALILAAPTNGADAKGPADEPAWGTKIPSTGAFIEEEALVSQALAEAEQLEAEEQTVFLEQGTAVSAKPTFEPDFVPSNHYGLLVQATQFAPRCPVLEEK